MGNKVIQRILECTECGVVPEDGAVMWEMGTGVWCEDCCAYKEAQSDTVAAWTLLLEEK